MEIEILNKKENPLLGRTEVRFRVTHEGAPTPKREEVRQALGKALNAPKESVVLDQLDSEFGRGQSHGYAKVYANQDLIKKVERPHILVRNKLAEKVAKEAKPAAAPATKPAPAPKPAAAPAAPAAPPAPPPTPKPKGGKPSG